MPSNGKWYLIRRLKINGKFYTILSATCFDSIYSNHLQGEVLFTSEGDIQFAILLALARSRVAGLNVVIKIICIEVIQCALK